MSVIVVDINKFTYDIPVYKLDETGKTSQIGAINLEDMGTGLINLCYNHNVYDIKISGSNSQAQAIVDEIIDINHKQNYSKNINIEVI